MSTTFTNWYHDLMGRLPPAYRDAPSTTFPLECLDMWNAGQTPHEACLRIIEMVSQPQKAA